MLIDPTYRSNNTDPANLETIKTKHHSMYIAVAKVDPGTVIRKSVFSMVAYREVLWLRGGNTSKFDKEVGAKFKKSAQGSRAPDDEKVAIDHVMLVCQCLNSVDVTYANKDGFRCLGMMALGRAKLQLKSGLVDANFCPLCAFWPTNNETLNNHIRKHYKMGPTCQADGFMVASVSVPHGDGARL